MKQAIELTLEQFLDEVAKKMEAESPAARVAAEKVRRVIKSGGKRIRPIFCLLGHAVAGGEEDERILKVAASLELLHTFAIIHDDLMDRSAKRRGEDTLVQQFEEELGGRGEGMATLIGDLAFVLSEMLFSNSGFGPKELQRAREHLDEMRLHAVTGQYLDLAMSGKPTSDVEASRAVARLKTASYSVEGPLRIGASLADAEQDVLDALTSYGRSIGEAFQLHDELSILPEANETDKDSLSDVRHGRPLALIAEAFSRAGDQERLQLENLWGKSSATESDLQAVREVVRETGADDALRKVIEDLHQAGLDALIQIEDIVQSAPSKEALRELRELPGSLLSG